jgi:hypothetical protein
MSMLQQDDYVMDEFPEAVREALGAVGPVPVPCAQPYGSIKLLQLIPHSHIYVSGLVRRKYVLANPGNSGDSLIRVFKDGDQREELITLVREAEHVIFKSIARNSMLPGFHSFFPLQVVDLAGVGLKTISDKNWNISFGNGQIEKKAVSMIGLTRFLEMNHMARSKVMRIFGGVVTAIYYITGGVRYTGDAALVTTNGVQLDPTPTGPVNIAAGWQYKVTDAGQVQLFEVDPTEWIVAIEYLRLKDFEKLEASRTRSPFTMIEGMVHWAGMGRLIDMQSEEPQPRKNV